MYHNFLIHSSASGHRDCFHVLAVVNSDAVNNGIHMAFQCWFPQAICLRVGFLGPMVVLFLVFKAISILFSKVSPVLLKSQEAKGWRTNPPWALFLKWVGSQNVGPQAVLRKKPRRASSPTPIFPPKNLGCHKGPWERPWCTASWCPSLCRFAVWLQGPQPQFSPLFPWGESQQGCCDSWLADPLSSACCLQLVWPLSEASALSSGLCPHAPVSPRSSDNSMLWAPMWVRSREHHSERDMVQGRVLEKERPVLCKTWYSSCNTAVTLHAQQHTSYWVGDFSGLFLTQHS